VAAAATLAPIGAVNRATEAELPGLLAPLLEDPGPLAGVLARRRPFSSWAALLDAAAEAAAGLDEPARIALLRGHPRLGTDPATLARRGTLSRAEQGDADADADRELAALNDAYEARFGFPFVEFVAGRPRSALVGVLRRRLGRARETELAAGVDAVIAIARDRLATLTGGAG
jgi:2-oxo-4-hydroxy-4-carboxy--5-ureidoimidazoline (OHCU) decarboxylase